MLEVTPQERQALIVLCVLLTGGAVARHAVNQADAREWLEYTAEKADTLNPASNPALRAEAEAELAVERVSGTPLGASEKIDPNVAPAEQLARLPRIGPALAARIVSHREANGPFRTAEELRLVSGIGPSLLAGIAPFLTLNRGPPAQTGRGSPSGQIKINSATVEELEQLPGIGPAIAARIVESRQANGRFKSSEELENVSGIGPRLRERLQTAAGLGN
jgi:competence ComEA-like helix-hairpin-helix protein